MTTIAAKLTERMPVSMVQTKYGRLEYSAYLSEDGDYRYLLQRAWANTRPLVFIGLNPSTADHLKDDATISLCMSLAHRWGFSGLLMVNAFAYRATDPDEMLNRSKELAIGPENDHWLREAAHYRDSLFVACWGAKCPKWRAREVAAMFPADKLVCLAKNADGSPHHPLRCKITGLWFWQPEAS